MTTMVQMGTRMAVVAENLVKVYGAGETAVRALDEVSVEFGAGQFTAIMGPSGSGKSTLMHCVAGLDTVDAGSIRLYDADGTSTELTALGDRALTRLRRSRIGFVFQSFNLLPVLTAEQNMTLPLELAGRRADPGWRRTTIPGGGTLALAELSRGFLHALVLGALAALLHRNRLRTWFWLALTFAVLNAWLPLIQRIDWPYYLRTANLVEVTCDAVVYGGLVVLLLFRRGPGTRASAAGTGS